MSSFKPADVLLTKSREIGKLLLRPTPLLPQALDVLGSPKGRSSATACRSSKARSARHSSCVNKRVNPTSTPTIAATEVSSGTSKTVSTPGPSLGVAYIATNLPPAALAALRTLLRRIYLQERASTYDLFTFVFCYLCSLLSAATKAAALQCSHGIPQTGLGDADRKSRMIRHRYARDCPRLTVKRVTGECPVTRHPFAATKYETRHE